ncbi:MAG: NAD(P)H-binding protein [Thermoleophilaceae bacterium]|nr:NAD(P)H-binding protein [Thermoleophilaceae bacterium]
MIAVLGATGTIGRELAPLLGEQDLRARAVVRSDVAADVPLTTTAGDLLDRDSLEQAFDGATDLFLLTPHGPEQDQMERNALAAAIAVGIQRIVKISGGGPSLGPNGATATAAAHWRSEQRIEASGLRFQFLRPSFLMQNLHGMPVKWGLMPAPMGRGPVAMVDARDVAESAAALLSRSDAPDGAWQLTGPSSVTFSDAARERGARYLSIPPRIARRALERRGASPFEVDHSIRMARYFASGADGSPSGDVAELTGHQPRALKDFFDDQSPVKGR